MDNRTRAPARDQHVSRGIRSTSRRSFNRVRLPVEEVTNEEEVYSVKVAGSESYLPAWRLHNKWYDPDGQYLTESSKIVAIQIPARWT